MNLGGINRNNILIAILIILIIVVIYISYLSLNIVVAPNLEFLNNNSGAISVIFSGLVVIATMIYTIGTFLLWLTTRKSLEFTRYELQQLRDQLQSETFQEIIRSHREIYSFLLSNDKLSKELIKGVGVKPNEFYSQMIGTFLINQASLLFHLNKYKTMDPSQWNNTKIDMKEMFQWQIVRKRWECVSHLHPEEFRKFIEDEIIS